jgi:hypothetical protein
MEQEPCVFLRHHENGEGHLPGMDLPQDRSPGPPNGNAHHRYDPINPCQPDTAAMPYDNDASKVNATRPLQSTHKAHHAVFRECQDWGSKWKEDKEWCLWAFEISCSVTTNISTTLSGRAFKRVFRNAITWLVYHTLWKVILKNGRHTEREHVVSAERA